MPIGSVSPVGIQQFFDHNGDPLAGGSLGFFLAGTDAPTWAYADVNLTIALPNPVVLDAAGRAPELFLAAVSYKQVLQDANGVTIWTADNITPPEALRSSGSVISLTGLQHNIPVPNAVVSFMDFRNSSPLTITGFSGGSQGQVLLLRANGTAPVHLLHGNTGSAVGHKLLNFAQSGPTSLVPTSGTALYVLSGEWWMLIAHEQGAWMQLVPDASFEATDAAGTLSGQWLVDPPDILQLHYRLSGTSLLMSVGILNASVIGAPVHLRVRKWPYAFKTGIAALPCSVIDNGVYPWVNGIVGAQLGGNALIFARNNASDPWPAVTNGNSVLGQVMADVV